MTLSPTALCSRALLKTGCRSIHSFDEGTAEAEVAEELYAPVRDALLSAYPWSFATGSKDLPPVPGKKGDRHKYAYELPDDFLRLTDLGVGVIDDFQIQGRYLYTDAESAQIKYIFRAKEAEVPLFFDEALIARLSAEFCIPLTDSTSRSEHLHREAQNKFNQACVIDADKEKLS